MTKLQVTFWRQRTSAKEREGKYIAFLLPLSKLKVVDTAGAVHKAPYHAAAAIKRIVAL